ncbi:MAG: hypothetical protein WC909_02225 [Candidatus Paceibacterota bacterium]|jgi:hypothetical protein
MVSKSMTWSSITMNALYSAWENIVLFIPNLLAAIIIFIIGWILATWIGKLVAGILNKAKFNSIFEKTGWKEALEGADIKVEPSGFIGAICKWILVVIFLMIATDIMGWFTFAGVLASIIAWIPNLIVSIIILIVAIVIADIIEKLVKVSTKKMGVNFVNFLGVVVKWGIYVFAGLAVLLQLGVAPRIVEVLIIGFVGTLALSLGLAFGLGGKDAASRLIEEAKRKISDE